jgi:thymidylate synthase (FAD)
MAHHIVPAAEEYVDKQIPVLDHGFIALVDYMGSDAAIAEAARTSIAGVGVKATSTDASLMRRLMSDLHTSPYEMVEMKFLCKMPIFVARQWIRHRTANVNEMSGRYSELPELTYVPDLERVSWQNPVNKQGSGAQTPEDIARIAVNTLRGDADAAFENYHDLLGQDVAPSIFTDQQRETIRANGGISRELARINLPLSTYTQWYWKIDLHNLLHFLFLRLDEHAQWEIRQYALVLAKIVEALCPIAWQAFRDYRLDAIRLSAPEIEIMGLLMEKYHEGKTPNLETMALEGHNPRMSNRELDLFLAKLAKLGLGFLHDF